MKAQKKSISDILFMSGNYTFLTLFMISCLFPFWYIFIYTVSDPQTAAKGLLFLPKNLSLFNFTQVFRLEGIFNSALISIERTFLGTLAVLLCSSFFAYLITKKEMYFRKTLYRVTIATMYLNAGLIPYYLTIKALGLRNNFLVYIIPGMMNAFYIILIKTFIEQLPESLEESAVIEGAGYTSIYSKIILPLIKPVLATITVFSAVGQWNSWFDAYIFTSLDSLKPLQLILWNMFNEASKTAQMLTASDMIERATKMTPMSVRMTITMVTIIPIMLVYPFAQKYFTKGILMGAIKG